MNLGEALKVYSQRKSLKRDAFEYLKLDKARLKANKETKTNFLFFHLVHVIYSYVWYDRGQSDIASVFGHWF